MQEFTGYITQTDLDKPLVRNGGAVSRATMGGGPLRLNRQATSILVGPGEADPKLTAAPISARNGMTYPIDQVIAPAKRSDRNCESAS